MENLITSPIIISHFTLFDKDCIRITFQYNREIVDVIVKKASAKWSMEYKCWYVLDTSENLDLINKTLSVFPHVKYLKKGEEFNLYSQYNSVFISYSLIDAEFAQRLNTILNDNGINTFLWELDAPYGKSLEKIMIENINKFDKLLFIASANSIKSSACQFELTNGRLKQDKLWQNILFPIHIDNFLFEIEKYNIRPRNKQDEYWLNITELRELNSADFSEFSGSEYNKMKFIEKAIKLVENLKKNSG